MLAMIGIVDCIFRRVGLRPSRFHSWAWGTAVSLPSEWDGTKQKFFDSYCKLKLNCNLTIGKRRRYFMQLKLRSSFVKQTIARQHVECTAALMYAVLQYIHHKQLDHNLAVTINKYKAFYYTQSTS